MTAIIRITAFLHTRNYNIPIYANKTFLGSIKFLDNLWRTDTDGCNLLEKHPCSYISIQYYQFEFIKTHFNRNALRIDHISNYHISSFPSTTMARPRARFLARFSCWYRIFYRFKIRLSVGVLKSRCKANDILRSVQDKFGRHTCAHLNGELDRGSNGKRLPAESIFSVAPLPSLLRIICLW